MGRKWVFRRPWDISSRLPSRGRRMPPLRWPEDVDLTEEVTNGVVPTDAALYEVTLLDVTFPTVVLTDVPVTVVVLSSAELALITLAETTRGLPF